MFSFSNQSLNGLKRTEMQLKKALLSSPWLIYSFILPASVNTRVVPDKIKTKHGNEWTNEWNFREYFRVQSSQ